MAWNGAGIFNRLYNWVTDKANSIPITASRMDGEFNNFKAGLENCLTKDWQVLPTAAINLNNQNLSGVGTLTVGSTATISGNATIGGTITGQTNLVIRSATPNIFSRHTTQNGMLFGPSASNSYALYRLGVDDLVITAVNGRHPMVINNANNHITFGGRVTVNDDSASGFCVLELGDGNSMLVRDPSSNLLISMLAGKNLYIQVGGVNYRQPIIQYGAVVIPATMIGVTVTFPVAFPASPGAVFLTPVGGISGAIGSVISVNASSMILDQNTGSAFTFYWLAIY